MKKIVQEKKHELKTAGIDSILTEYLNENERVIVAQNATYKDGNVRHPKACIFILTDERLFFIPKKGNQPNTIDMWHVIDRLRLINISLKKDSKPRLEVEFFDNEHKKKNVHIFNIGIEESNKLLKEIHNVRF